MTANLDIREYRPSDAERVWTIHELALRASPLRFVENAKADHDLKTIRESYIEADGAFLVGLLEDDIVAMGGFLPHDETTAEIRRMRVHPEHQRQGYGNHMLSALEERLRGQGYRRVVLNTHEDLTTARNLYTSSGYEETHRKTIPQTQDELIHYEKHLSSDGPL